RRQVVTDLPAELLDWQRFRHRREGPGDRPAAGDGGHVAIDALSALDAQHEEVPRAGRNPAVAPGEGATVRCGNLKRERRAAEAAVEEEPLELRPLAAGGPVRRLHVGRLHVAGILPERTRGAGATMAGSGAG